VGAARANHDKQELDDSGAAIKTAGIDTFAESQEIKMRNSRQQEVNK
jgi:hypothetical protein